MKKIVKHKETMQEKTTRYRQVQDRWGSACRPVIFRDRSKYHRSTEKASLRREINEE